MPYNTCTGGCDGSMIECERKRVAGSGETGFIAHPDLQVESEVCRQWHGLAGDEYMSWDCAASAPAGWVKLKGGCTEPGSPPSCCLVREDVYNAATPQAQSQSWPKLSTAIPWGLCVGNSEEPE